MTLALAFSGALVLAFMLGWLIRDLLSIHQRISARGGSLDLTIAAASGDLDEWQWPARPRDAA